MNGTMADVLVATDVFIDHLRGARRFVPGDHRVWYFTVTRCGLFSGRRVDEDIVRKLLSAFTEMNVNRAIAETAGRLRRAFQVRTPDALVAASALTHGLTLLTRNVRNFAPVPDLDARSSEQ